MKNNIWEQSLDQFAKTLNLKGKKDKQWIIESRYGDELLAAFNNLSFTQDTPNLSADAKRLLALKLRVKNKLQEYNNLQPYILANELALKDLEVGSEVYYMVKDCYVKVLEIFAYNVKIGLKDEELIVNPKCLRILSHNDLILAAANKEAIEIKKIEGIINIDDESKTTNDR